MMIDERLARQGTKLREIRETFFRSPEEVALYLGFSNRQSVYDMEAGRRDLKAYEALLLAEYYGVSTESLLSDASADCAVVYWRGDADLAAEKILLTRLQRYSKLETLADFHPWSGMPSFSLSGDSSFEYVGGIASSVADILNLGQYPARVLADALRKKWNVLVFHATLKESSGACVAREGINAILLNTDEVWWRRNFSLGHELFHLLFTDCATVPSSRVEILANVFASHLLMPGESFKKDVESLMVSGTMKYFNLISLAKEYMVSTEALLWRMHTLGIIKKEGVEEFKTNGDLRDLDRDVHNEIQRIEPELPGHMVMLAYRVYLNGSISVGKLAEYLETTVGKLKSVLRSYGIEPFAGHYETSLTHT